MTTTTTAAETQTRYTVRVQMRGRKGQWFTSASKDGLRAEDDALTLAGEVAGDTSDTPTGISVTVHAYTVRANGERAKEGERLVKRLYSLGHDLDAFDRAEGLRG